MMAHTYTLTASSLESVDQGLPGSRRAGGGTTQQPQKERDAHTKTHQTLQQEKPCMLMPHTKHTMYTLAYAYHKAWHFYTRVLFMRIV